MADVTPAVRGIERTSPAFRRAVTELAGRMGVDPLSLFLIMSFETGATFNPAKENPVSKAVGLIQFMPSTAQAMGTSSRSLAAMTAIEQLEWVERYFSKHPGISSLEDLYMAVLWPLAIGKDRDYVLWHEGSREYLQNRGLDTNADGSVTVGEATGAVRGMLRSTPKTPIPGRLLIVGDSLVLGLGPAMSTGLSARGVVMSYNGVSGATMPYWLGGSRLARVMEDTNPSLTLVCLGTNDAKAWNTASAGMRAKEVVDSILRNGSAAAWVTPPALPFASDEFRRGLREAIGDSDIRAFDSLSLTIARQPDRIHPTPEGYRAWGDAIIQWLGGSETLSLSVLRPGKVSYVGTSPPTMSSALLVFMLPLLYGLSRRR